MYSGAPFDVSASSTTNQGTWQQSSAPPEGGEQVEGEEEDTGRRPPNAFILYSQAMRSQVRQENPSLSNTECSRRLGEMWKDVTPEEKQKYKKKAQILQEEFKKEHPNYTYRKARKKRALNELLSKSAQGYPIYGDPMLGMMMPGGQYPMMQPGMFGQPIPMMGQMPGQPGMPQVGQMSGIGAQMGLPMGLGYQGIDPNMYQSISK